MKIPALVVFGLAALHLLQVGTVSAAPNEFHAFILELKPGATLAETRRALGAPDATLGADLWIYWRPAANPNRHTPEFDTLVVAFSGGKVSAVKLTDGRVVQALLDKAARSNTAAVAANGRQH